MKHTARQHRSSAFPSIQRSVEDKEYRSFDASKRTATSDEFLRCTFTGCDLSGGTISGKVFSECLFTGCNLSLTNVTGASFRDTVFRECKLTGVRFDESDALLFSAEFDRCVLDNASFTGMALKLWHFAECSMKGTDLSGCDLSGAHFERCDLERAVFDRTNLSKADLRTAFNVTIDPEQNRLAKAKFSLQGAAGLLAKYDIIIE